MIHPYILYRRKCLKAGMQPVRYVFWLEGER